MKLRYDPYQIFKTSKTPAGLYARQKWLGQAGTREWQTDFEGTVSALWIGQMPDGSWRHASQTTVERLFGLHLTVRSSTPQIETALEWLINKMNLTRDDIQVCGGASNEPLHGLPFVLSRPAMFLTGATLFLASIFGHGRNPEILSVYRRLSEEGLRNGGVWNDIASSHNIFRSMVVHPDFADDASTAMAVEHLAGRQTRRGDWGDESSFYQTLNALSHLKTPKAYPQLETAFQLVFDTQNKDGTWSQTEPEWNTFLVIHAMKNQKRL